MRAGKILPRNFGSYWRLSECFGINSSTYFPYNLNCLKIFVKYILPRTSWIVNNCNSEHPDIFLFLMQKLFSFVFPHWCTFLHSSSSTYLSPLHFLQSNIAMGFFLDAPQTQLCLLSLVLRYLCADSNCTWWCNRLYRPPRIFWSNIVTVFNKSAVFWLFPI